MDTELLRIFIEVATNGSFATAARTRNLDPSSVSRLIGGLEKELGARLFQRSTRKLTLTEAGEVYLAKLAPVLDELAQANEAAQTIAAAPRGALRMTLSVSFGQMCILPHIPEFYRRYPNVQLELLFNDDNVDLVAHRIDLAVRLAPSIEGDLIVTKLIDTHYRVVASPRYLKQHPHLSGPTDLCAHRCLLFPYKGFRSSWHFKNETGQVCDVNIQGAVTLSTAMALRDMTLVGMGPCLLPDWLVHDDVAKGRLIDIFPSYACTATSFDTAAWLVYPSRSFLPSKVRVMIDYLKEVIVRS
jgi:DNA-binding transcriptional LysR family regulator